MHHTTFNGPVSEVIQVAGAEKKLEHERLHKLLGQREFWLRVVQLGLVFAIPLMLLMRHTNLDHGTVLVQQMYLLPIYTSYAMFCAYDHKAKVEAKLLGVDQELRI